MSTAGCSPSSPTSGSASTTVRSTASGLRLGEERAPDEVGVLSLAVDGQVVAVAGEVGRDEIEALHGTVVVVAVGDGRAGAGELVVVVVEDALEVCNPRWAWLSGGVERCAG